MIKSHNLLMSFIALDAFLKTSVCIHIMCEGTNISLLVLKGMCDFPGDEEQPENLKNRGFGGRKQFSTIYPRKCKPL